MTLMSQATAEAARIAEGIRAAQPHDSELMSQATAEATSIAEGLKSNYPWDKPEDTLKAIRAAGDDRPLEETLVEDHYSEAATLQRFEEFAQRARG